MHERNEKLHSDDWPIYSLKLFTCLLFKKAI
jgi:hypothetical protein